ncbi:hypothetical protein BV22DRAFT_1000695 [Leucogyrophana mollusca]|uniref:Uncharacterized protein n=1 Tax=Leucogyrophana mollusca TaxID=85980 RepID=A0ACB8BWX3_9AGAM|nr:hypothetical protein BV22DRAFT_1000695 [Leucogyrophana mollusca]
MVSATSQHPRSSSSTIVGSIQKIAEDIVAQCGLGMKDEMTSSHSYPGHSPVTITLPEPQSLLPVLLSLGAKSEWAQEIDQAYRRRASELRQGSEAAVSRLCSDLVWHPSLNASGFQEKVISVFSELYRKRLGECSEDVLRLVKDRIFVKGQTATTPVTRSQKPPTPFNQEYVPLLEHYFDENPFPTRADKDFLAKKSGMEYRQIHVWFQNRRNRTKKEGKVLKKKPMSEGATLPLDDLYARMEKYIVPEDRRVKVVDSDEVVSPFLVFSYNLRRPSSPVEADVQNVLDGPAPSHAFPSTYPPVCEYNPFPCKDGVHHFEAPQPQWLRRSSSAPATRPPAMPMSDFIEKFSQLHVRDGSGNRSRQNVQTTTTILHTEANSFAASLTFTVISPPAPHPAFIPRSALTPASLAHPLPAVAAPTSRLHVFNTPSPQSRPVTLVPIAETETPTRKKAGRRKVAALPRRVPQGTSIAHRGVTPAVSEASLSSPSPSSSSRSPSFDSESGHSRMFSTVSSSSDSSSRVTTPVSSSPSLPAQIFSPSLSLPGFSFDLPSNMGDLFGDSVHGSPSPVEGLQLDFQSSIFGHSGIVKPPSFNFSRGIYPVSSLVTMRS